MAMRGLTESRQRAIDLVPRLLERIQELESRIAGLEKALKEVDADVARRPRVEDMRGLASRVDSIHSRIEGAARRIDVIERRLSALEEAGGDGGGGRARGRGRKAASEEESGK